MKKLLILAYDFPPYVSVGGLRPYNWYKYLKEYGVEPIVVTRNWSNDYGNELDYIAPSPNQEIIVETSDLGTIIRTPYKPTLGNRILLKYGPNKFRTFRRLLTAVDEVRQFITVSGPKKELYFAAKKYLQEHKVDAIIATGDPFVLFYYANKLSFQFDVPWIADYRDPWSQDKTIQEKKLFSLWIKFIEKKIVSHSREIITVSDFLEFKIADLIKNKPIHIFPNGYDPEVIDQIAILPQSTDKLTISFVGTIYKWHPWESFLELFSEFLEAHLFSVQLNLYGINNADEVSTYLTQFPEKTQSSIAIFPRLPNEELLNKIAQENVMLLFNYYSFMGTKIFDYLGVRRKIVLCYQNDEKALELKDKYFNIDEIEGVSKQLQADLIKETNSGIVVENEAHLKIVLEQLGSEFQEKGFIACDSVGVENYSRKIQVKKLAEVVKDLARVKK